MALHHTTGNHSHRLSNKRGETNVSINSTSLLASQFKAASIGQGNTITLKPGQLLSGRVVEIFPNQQAMIQIGDQQMVAQLKTALTLNRHYWFQVQSTDQLPHLKVLVNQTGAQSMEQQALALLKQLQFPLTKQNIQFVQTLIQAQISFRPHILAQALQINANNKQASTSLLLNMMTMKLPITSTVYQGLAAMNTKPLLPQLQQLYQLLLENNDGLQIKQALGDRLFSMIANHNMLTSSPVQIINQQIDRGDALSLELLKHMGLVSDRLTITQGQDIKSQLQSAVNRYGSNYFSDLIGKTFSRQLGLTDHQVRHFAKLVQAIPSFGDNLAKQSAAIEPLHAFINSNHLSQRIAALLSNSERNAFNKWKQQPNWNNVESILPAIKELSDQQLLKDQQLKLLDLLAVSKHHHLPIKEQFLLHLKHFLHFSGINHEHLLAQGNTVEIAQHQSLKYLLLQALQSSTRGSQEIEQLIQTLNGLQITSVQEEGAFIQTSIQIPNLFGADKNIQLDMESKRSETGQINPDFCHIVFFLELEKIGDTWIDMSVQDRRISLTVYNQYQQINTFIDEVEPMLREGLNKIDYQLSSIQFKVINDKMEQQLRDTKRQPAPRPGGVDVRV